jgi:methyl-accepting chemotaxis protein
MITQQATRPLPGLQSRTNRLVVSSMVILVAVTLLFVVMNVVSLRVQAEVSAQQLTLQQNLDQMLTGMINQETGLPGYIMSANTAFLDPFHFGCSQYLAAVRELRTHLASGTLPQSVSALSAAQARAEAWYTIYALRQIANVEVGRLNEARSLLDSQAGKRLFDGFRAAFATLERVIGQDIASLQNQISTSNMLILGGGLVLTLGTVMAFGWRLSSFSRKVLAQLLIIKTTCSSLVSDDLGGRIPPPGLW